MNKLVALTSILLTTGSVVFATSTTTYGTLSDFTYGNSNPNNAFEITTIQDGGNTITLGLEAQARFLNPTLGNNGAGIFYASAGANYGNPSMPAGPGPSGNLGTTWNFDFYYNATTLGYTYQLFYGLDGTTLASFNPASPSDNKGTLNNGGQNSENILFDLNGQSFDPNANGIYDFELVAYNSAGAQVGSSAIQVQVGTVPDATSTAALLALGFVGLAAFGVRQNRVQAVK